MLRHFDQRVLHQLQNFSVQERGVAVIQQPVTLEAGIQETGHE